MDTTYSHVAAPRTGRSANAETESDLANRYPVDDKYWCDFEIVSVGEAVLLSLAIEPRDIRDPYNQSGGISNFQQGREYSRRLAVIRNAIAAKVLAKAVTDDPAYSDHVGLKGFVAWAADKRWSMPEWMHRINTSLSSGSLASPDIAPGVECDQDAQDATTIYPASPTHTAIAGLRKQLIATAFDRIYWCEQQWKENLGDCPGWLGSAMATPGRKGKGGGATWNPVAVALQLHDIQRIPVPILSKAFREKPILQPWLAEWREVKDNFSD